MSDNVAAFLKDLIIFLTLALTVYSQLKTKAAVVQTKEAVEKTEVKVDQLEKNTNSKFDKLLETKDQLANVNAKAERAAGNLEGRAAEKLDAQSETKVTGPSLGHLSISEIVVPEQTLTVEPTAKKP